MKNLSRRQLRKIINEATDKNNEDMHKVLSRAKLFLDEFNKFAAHFSRYIRNQWFNDRRTHGMKQPHINLTKALSLGIEGTDISVIKSNIAVIITEFNMHIKSRKTDHIKALGHQVIKEIDRLESNI